MKKTKKWFCNPFEDYAPQIIGMLLGFIIGTLVVYLLF